jgi:phage regulator Rha-like protein
LNGLNKCSPFGVRSHIIRAYEARSPDHPCQPDREINPSLRGQKVMLDTDLADLYQVPTKVLNQAVRRNKDRFPADFMFQLTADEFSALRSQIVTLDTGRGQHRKYLPYAFTEQGVAMLSSVLRSKRAVNVNIEIMRAFVRLRELLATHKDLANKLEMPERKYDAQFKVVFDAIHQLMKPSVPAKRKIGFLAKEKAAGCGKR